jgi:AcrR family transcriptional regulator
MDKKDHIMSKAVELFAEKGFEATSIRELAAKAEVNVAMINYYFGSKDKLFEAMVEKKASFMRDKLEDIAANKKLSDIEKVDAIIDNYVERMLLQPDYTRVLYQELLTKQREGLQEIIKKKITGNKEIIKSIIESGIKKKSFRKVDPELIMASIVGTINQVMLSKSMCLMLIDKDDDFDPYTDKPFRKRLETHLKQMIHAYLLNE